MKSSVSEFPFDHTSLKIIESLIDMNKDLVFVFHNDKPILFNKASKNFFGLDSLEEFAREFGTLENRFMPHDFYFHAEKTEENQTWRQAISSLDESDRIVSMLNHNIKPHAFSVTIDIPVDGYEIVFFHDITTDLIKRIMTENKTNLDTNTVAYTRNYFEHISSRLITAAIFNEKSIGICLVEFDSDDKNFIKSISESIKSNIRTDDMLVRWSEKSFVIVFLVGSEEHVHLFGRKIVDTIKELHLSQTVRIGMSVQREQDTVQKIIKRCENVLEDTQESFSFV